MLSHFSCVQRCATLWTVPPDSSVHGILQARILEWVAIPFSRESSWPRDWTQVSGLFLTIWATREGPLYDQAIPFSGYIWSKWDFLGGTNGKEPACQCRKHKIHAFDPWVGKIPWRMAWQLISCLVNTKQIFLLGKFHGQRSLVVYSPQSCKESDMTEELSMHACTSANKITISKRYPNLHIP